MIALPFSHYGRGIVRRTSGRTRGPITRLVSPSDLGELMKPFVFLDFVEFDGDERIPLERFWHPHSGIATVTVALEGAVRVVDTTGTDLVLPPGGVEWMNAGNGVWHTGQAQPGYVKAFQLWVALPPALENGPSRSQYVMPHEVPNDGRVSVILGAFEGKSSPIDGPANLTYLLVTLKDGERWTYSPPAGHDVAWLAVGEGSLSAPAVISTGEVAVFEESAAPIDVVASGNTRFVIGSAKKHPHALVLGRYSVHTSQEALWSGETEIRRLGDELVANGTLSD